MPKTKKIPMRMCIACREMKPKKRDDAGSEKRGRRNLFRPDGQSARSWSIRVFGGGLLKENERQKAFA